MRQSGKRKRKRRTLIPTIILLVILLACGVYIWKTLKQDKAEELVEYTVARGTIQTYKSFSATLSVENSETFTNTEGVTMVKELYVTSGQEVKKGDPILTLGTGKTYEASMAGTINEIRFKKGDYVWPNISLAQVCDLEHLLVQLQVDEYDIKKVETGQKCVVTIIPLSMEFETVISHVNRMSASNGRVAYYPVTAKLTVPENVLPGMSVSVRLADETAENVLMLPMAAITFDDDKPCVKIKSADGYELKQVSLGLSDGMQIEITEGVNEGDTVYAKKTDSSEEETGVLTRLLRKIFGTKTVIQEEQSGRDRGGSRGGFPGAPEGGFPGSAEGGFPGAPEGGFPGMPGTDGQIPDGMRPNVSTDGEADRQGRPGADASQSGTFERNAGTRPDGAGSWPGKSGDETDQTGSSSDRSRRTEGGRSGENTEQTTGPTKNVEQTESLKTKTDENAAGNTGETKPSGFRSMPDGSFGERPERPSDMQRPETGGNSSERPQAPGRSGTENSQSASGEENAQ